MGGLLNVSSLTAAWIIASAAWALGDFDVAVAQTRLGLQELLDGYAKHSSLDDYRGALSARTQAAAAAETRRLRGPVALAVEGEASPKNRPALRGQAVLRQSFAIGLDADAAQTRFTAEAEADLAARESERLEQEREIVLLYVRLRERQAHARASFDAVKALDPVVQRTRSAARSGTVSGLVATRAEFQLAAIQDELALARSAFAAEAGALSRLTGVTLGPDPLKQSLDALPGTYRDALPPPESAAPVRESLARQRALGARATAAGGVAEVVAGVGVSRDFATNETGVVFAVELPLGAGYATSSEVRALDREQAVSKAEANLALARAKDTIEMHAATIKRLEEAVRIASNRAESLGRFRAQVHKAFGSGQGDVAEVVETEKEEHEARIRLSEIAAELDEAIVIRFYAAAGGKP